MQYVSEFELTARGLLDPAAWDFFSSGSGLERTMTANRTSFGSWNIWPKILVDVSAINTETELFGDRIALPVLIAPVAYQKLAHPQGELATARGSAQAGTIFVVSTVATVHLEQIAQQAGCLGWFQLYVHQDRCLTADLVRRAEAAGYRAVVITVDAPVLGIRRNGPGPFKLPTGLSAENYARSRPEAASDELGRLMENRHDASLTWDDVARLKESCSVPVLLKGILRGDDAAKAVDCGVDGLVVSNHGGRQLDGAPSSLEALEEVVDAVDGRIPVLADGGVRCGGDLFKMLALGAQAVMVGRPIIWGLATDGSAGVARVLEILRCELVQIMKLAGCPTLNSIDRSMLKRANGLPIDR
ncbi:MAG: alpha-hydroxy acid oxidase [Actinomycetota bacterium]